MQDDTLDCVDRRVPGRALDHPPRVSVSGLAAEANAGGAKVDVLQVVFAVESRRKKAHHMHRGPATPGCEFPAFRAVPRFRRKFLFELSNHMAQPVNLLLAGDMAVIARRITDVLLARHHLPDRRGLSTSRLPDIYAKDHRVAPRVVVEHRLERGVRVEPAVPEGFAVDPNRREAGR